MMRNEVRRSERLNILGVGVDPIDMQDAIQIIAAEVRKNRKGYVCLVGVHGVMEAQYDSDLRAVFSKALLVAPDGMPTVWIGRLKGLSKMRRVFGPDLMVDIMGREEFRNCVHFFCGGSPGVAARLRDEMSRRFPGTQIAGVYVPPYRQMTLEEESELVTSVRSLQPDIIWVGLSTPKQERFMARYLPMLDTRIMIGVGAAFLFHTGAIRDSPDWVKQVGLQWLHRLVQEPTRLWRRYLLNNPLFIYKVIVQLFGWKRYQLEPKTDIFEMPASE